MNSSEDLPLPYFAVVGTEKPVYLARNPYVFSLGALIDPISKKPYVVLPPPATHRGSIGVRPEFRPLLVDEDELAAAAKKGDHQKRIDILIDAVVRQFFTNMMRKDYGLSYNPTTIVKLTPQILEVIKANSAKLEPMTVWSYYFKSLPPRKNP